ncbi:MAG: DUF11 domain-containing protein [Gemmatimonadaceae bacterium]|nr:DUF11 domain-containing protein [Gemmatimonadaceae bacterium]
MKSSVLTKLLVVLTLAAPVRAQAPAKPASALAVTAENRTAMAAAAQGAKRTDAAVHAGDVLRYKLTFTNIAGRPVRQVALQNPVASGLQFVAGSASSSRQDARAEYSADHGATWSAKPMETVTIDGKRVERAVAPERYTGVRWIVDGWVSPGATVTAQFEARLASR